jgi:hypothetical protein
MAARWTLQRTGNGMRMQPADAAVGQGEEAPSFVPWTLQRTENGMRMQPAAVVGQAEDAPLCAPWSLQWIVDSLRCQPAHEEQSPSFSPWTLKQTENGLRMQPAGVGQEQPPSSGPWTLKRTADGLCMKSPDEVVGQQQAPSGGRRPPTAPNPEAEVLGRTKGVESTLYNDFISPHGVSPQANSEKYSLYSDFTQ